MLPKRRNASPTFGNSSLTTSAPNSANCVEQNGPARKLDTSIIFKPSSGRTPAALSCMPVSSVLHCGGRHVTRCAGHVSAGSCRLRGGNPLRGIQHSLGRINNRVVDEQIGRAHV